jgi:hypothetical protein
MDPSLFPETLMSLLKTPRLPVVVDVRKRPAFEAAPAMLPGAVWRDPHAASSNGRLSCRLAVRSSSTACMAMR